MPEITVVRRELAKLLVAYFARGEDKNLLEEIEVLERRLEVLRGVMRSRNHGT
jgi:hypothetical protein